jgi:hypothetical protein
MELINFITPYYYTFGYNRKGFEGIAYFLEYTMLPFITYWIYRPDITIVGIILILTIITTTYELGYIFNNIVSIKKEKEATLRHSSEELAFGSENLIYIVFIRIAIIILLFIALTVVDQKYVLNTLVGVILISFIFYLYNKVRSGWGNRVLFFLLRFTRYYFVLFFIGFPAFIISLLISSVNLMNHLSWYGVRTKFNLPRLFGTKLFDGLMFFAFMCMGFLYGNKQIAYVFLYLAAIKFILFGYKLFRGQYEN